MLKKPLFCILRAVKSRYLKDTFEQLELDLELENLLKIEKIKIAATFFES